MVAYKANYIVYSCSERMHVQLSAAEVICVYIRIQCKHKCTENSIHGDFGNTALLLMAQVK